MPPAPPRDTQRIAKLLARAGIASRREIERMIAERRIAINGQVVETPATLLASLHGVTVDGHPVKAAAPTRLFRYHKPAGVLTTEHDPKGRPTIYSRLPKDLPRVMPVGRLDMNTEGLLLLTTDGELKRQLELPATGVERTYRARAFGEISQEQLEGLIEGIEIEGIRYGPIDANLERRTGRNQWIEMKLREGKNREVRRVLEHFGLQISRLIRTTYGPFHLEDLPAGAVDEVRQHDLVAFRKDVTAPGSRADSSRAAGGGARPRRPQPVDRRLSPKDEPARRAARPRRPAGDAMQPSNRPERPFARDQRPQGRAKGAPGGGPSGEARRPPEPGARTSKPSAQPRRPGSGPHTPAAPSGRATESGSPMDRSARPAGRSRGSRKPGSDQDHSEGRTPRPPRSQHRDDGRLLSSAESRQHARRAETKTSEPRSSRGPRNRPSRPAGKGLRPRHRPTRDPD